ncbi:acyl transferase domain-containing protein [Truncatella angustata]|uniref:Acyl transferase domain-containing protein n=1 Tax=Truncatella angustata TaxID=152316 RepID=A0A9P8ZUK4_9PEZI|nr:acyl transferase domain-containing protein [Truncatella angustata]KAH6649117.1 acyl transferase domain-containing protein [Truncatella angustata]
MALPNTPVAICGMGVRLPGGIRSSSELFEFLVNKGDARNVVPEDRYNVEAYHDPAGKPGFIATKYGYYLDVDLAQFDASMFRISNAELAAMDPSQRLLLEVTREAFESAGEADFRGRNIGTFVGDFTEDWQDLQNADLLNPAPYQMTGKADFALANRLAFEYDLLGPSVSIKTACSATAEAVHQAVLAIRAGSCPSAIVAGANIIITPRISMAMTQFGLLAADGNCKTFDVGADGFARGESVCALYIKRLDDAIRDGNPIRAVIRACDSNADGGDGSRTFGTPNAVAQEKLIRQTYELAGLPLAETKVIELHGTGTPVGDPLETTAIAACFGGEEKVYIGSVKPNLGHGEVPWDRNLSVPIEPCRWPEGILERVSINSFGLGGSNVHIVIDSAASMGIPSPRRGEPAAPSESPSVSRVAFVFTGQGAQWVGMGREMMQENATFAGSIRSMDKVLKSLEHPPDWTLEELLLTDTADKDLLNPVDRAQPICTAIQVAYVDALAVWDIRPSAVTGHSSGEIAAAYAAGIFTSREAIITAYYRGYACTHNKAPGGMAAVGMGGDNMEQFLKPGVVIACENSNASVTISGDLEVLDEIIDSLKEAHPNLFVRKLRVTTAYHSHHMSTVGDLYKSLITPHLAPKPPQVPFYSTVYGRQVGEGKVFGPQYWQLNLVSPVLFRTAGTRLLVDMPSTAHLEIGPHASLAGPLRQIYKETGHSAPYAALADRGQDASRTFLTAVGKLYCFGIAPRVPSSDRTFTLPELPSYPWNYETRHWAETRVMAGLRFRKHRKHELLGLRILESSETEPAWRNVLRLGEVPWLADHCVENDIVFPAAGYIAIAGTAVAQLTSSSAYTVQDVNIAAAMLLTEGKGTEIITTLRKHSLTVSKDSKWWEFSISSENNGTWTKHCWGLVTDGCGVALPLSPVVTPNKRFVDSKRWYAALSRIGLNYSNRFIGLDNITASPVKQSASASVTDYQDEGEVYALHPSTLDLVLQSWSVALAQGEYRRLDRLFLPTFIEQFYVSAEGSQATLHVSTTSHGRIGATVGDSYGIVSGDGKVAFLLKGFQVATMESALSHAAPELKSMSLQWHPAIDFTSPETLMRPSRDVTADIMFAEQFGLLCAAEIHEEATTVTSLAQPFFKHFLDGVAKHMDQVDKGLSNIPDAQDLKALSRAARREKLEQWREKSKGRPVEVIAETLWRVYYNIRDLLEGRETLIDVLLVGGLLQRFYDETNSWSDITDFFRVLGLNKPQIRVLEIGAGTGSTTAIVLAAMKSSHGEHLYEDYTITDVSAGFVNQTKERFSQYPNLKFAVCDITVDPLEQGFAAASYDLIIASNVLHATPNLIETLTRCRTLLKPDGQIFMQEFCGHTRYADLIMGLFDGWWAGINDGRAERPVLQEEAWDSKLQQSGFHGIQSAVRDNKHPHFFNTTNILARARSNESFEPSDIGKHIITLLKPTHELDNFGQNIKSSLETAGYTVDEYVWGARLPEGQDIVSLMDVNDEHAPILANVGADDLTTFIDLVGDVSGQALLWLMRPAQTQCLDPQYGQIPGVARCIRAELAIDFVTFELDKLDSEASQAVAQVLGRVQRAQQAASENDSLDMDSEYVWRNGQVLISRIHTSSVDQALANAAPQTEAKHLTIGQPGMLQTMCWTGHPLPPIAPNQVQIRIKVTGLNFHDVAVAMGIVGPDGQMEKDGYHGLGSEGLAIVTAVGEGVEHVAVGDRVVFMEILTSCFATEMQLPAELVARAPAGVSDEDAAGLIIPYATVLWSFLEKAHMKRGQSVLIHSAAGGVGIAAIHIARWIGADIYCTVGSPVKVDFLVNELGIPRDRIFQSHDDSFVADVMRFTDGLGVDVVLNSLSGELLHASWKCVAAGGCMVDIGKRDFLGRGRLAMNPFVGNRAFFGVDLATMIVTQKYRLVPFLRQSIELFEAGEIVPLYPTTVFEAEKIQDAFRYMQKGIHMGRIVVRMPEDPASLPIALPAPKPIFSPDGVYLLAGGLGGLGRSILSWMASHGARHLIVFSPSAGTLPEHRLFVEELGEMGCELRCIAGDVANYDFVQKVVADAGNHPIKGVLQLAMVLRDAGFLNMDHEAWTTTTNPKIQGTMNLHELLPKDLDFFIMCGSTGGTLGAYGQSNYAAANAYLDAFLHFRHGQGLPAAVLDIAAIGDIGYVAVNKNVAERLGRALAGFMVEAEFLRCLQLAVERSSSKYIVPMNPTPTVAFEEPSQVVLYNDTALPLADPQNTASFRRDPRLSVFRNTQGAPVQGDGAGNEGLRTFLGSLTSEPERLDDLSATIFLAEEIAKRIFAFLMQEDAVIDTSQTLTSMGADSLVAIEIRNWWKQTLGIEITVLELADSSKTMELLGALAVQRLKEKLQSN